MNEEIVLTNKLLSLIDEVTFAVADQLIQPTSPLFKAVTEAKKALKGSFINPETGKYLGNTKYKWTQFGMLEHCLFVTEYVLNRKMPFSMAVIMRASEVNKEVSSIRQACCRALNLKADDWHKMSSGNKEYYNLIKNKLLDKYPTQKNIILETFNTVHNSKNPI